MWNELFADNIFILSESYGLIYFYYKKNPLKKALYYINYPEKWFDKIIEYVSKIEMPLSDDINKKFLKFTFSKLDKALRDIHYTNKISDLKKFSGKKFYGSSFIIVDKEINVFKNLYFQSPYFSTYNVVVPVLIDSIRKFKTIQPELLKERGLYDIDNAAQLFEFIVRRNNA